MRFADPDELGDFMGVSFDAGQVRQAQVLLDFATAEMQVYIGQHIEFVEDDEVTIDAPYLDAVFLPELPVTDVSAVEVDGSALTLPSEATFDASGVVYRVNSLWWTSSLTGRQKLVVTYSHGYETIPTALKAVCCSLAGRMMEGKNGTSVDAEGNPAVRSVIPRAGVLGVFTDEEKSVMDGYRLLTVA